MKKKIILGLLVVSLVVFVACTSGTKETTKDVVLKNNNKEMMNDDTTHSDDNSKDMMGSWLETTLKDVRTDEEFKISDFAGKPVLIESFAVWCPNCKRQQQTMQELHEELGDEIVSISLDTDPNENEETVKEYVRINGFDGKYVMPPTEVTQSLIDEFGVGIVNAPSVPVILVCADQNARLLDRGHKSVETLKEEIEKGCSA